MLGTLGGCVGYTRGGLRWVHWGVALGTLGGRVWWIGGRVVYTGGLRWVHWGVALGTLGGGCVGYIGGLRWVH